MQDLMNEKTSTLRGGGCGASRQSQNTYRNLKSDIQNIEIFITRFDSYVNTICSKATVAASQQESQEIMIAIQWFIFQEENIYQLSKDSNKVMQTYNLMLEGIRRLLKSCLIYIRTDQFKCFYILQITATISKVIFSFHMINNERFMKQDLQKQFLDISDELQQQMQIEKNDLIQLQMENYLFLIRTSFEIAPNNSTEREEILKGCLSGIISSITQMKPSHQLLESLFRGACLLYKMHSINKIRIQYEAYFQIDMLQWEIISYFKNEKQKNLEEVLNQIEAMHKNLVKNSNNWMNHFLWIQMIGKILIYNPLLRKQKLYQLASSYNIAFSSSQIWKQYQSKGLIIQMNHEQAVIQLNQFQNKQLLYLDRIILEDFFKQPEQFILLKDFLLNEQSQNIDFTFRSYLQNKLKVSTKQEENENVLALGKIQKFFDFNISNKFLTLIKENYQKLGVVLENYKKYMEKNTKFNEQIQQVVYKSQINNMIVNLQEYIQNNQKIRSISMLNSRKGNHIIKQNELQNELQNCYQLKYLMKVIEQIIQSLIQRFKNKMDDQRNESFIQNQNHETVEIMDIQKELTQLQLQNSWLNDLKNKLVDLLAASIKQKNFLKIATSLIQLITNSWKELEQIEQLEISSLQTKDLLIQFIEIQLNNLYLEYYDLESELQNDTDESMQLLKHIIQIKYEIKIENPRDIELINNIEKLRLKHLKLHLKLDSIKKSFLNILAQTNQQDLHKLQEFINLDEFLFSVIKDYPQKIDCQKSDIDKLILAELTSIQFIKEDYHNKLQNQKGSIEYFKLYLSIEEYKISSQLQGLELIEKEFKDIFMDESSSQILMDKIIEGLSIDELLKYVSEKDFNLSELELKKQKSQFQNGLSQLMKIKDQSKYQNRDQNQIVQQLSLQIEIVIKTLGTFGSLDKEIFLILIKAELNKLKNLIEQNDNTIITKQNNQNNYQNEEIQSQKQVLKQTEISVVLQNYKKFYSFSNENCHTYLLYMIKVVQQQLQRIKEEKELLHNLFQDITNFSDNLDQIQSHNEELQNQCFKIFQSRFQQFITSFEKLVITIINLQQKEDEHFDDYFKRILSNLQQGVKDTDIIQMQQFICDFLNSLQVYLQEKLAQAKYFSNTSINQQFFIQQLKKLYFMDNQEDDFNQSNQELGLVDMLKQQFYDFKDNEEWKIKQSLVFTIIQISSNCFTDSIISFCQNTLIQLWVSEKDQRVRNLLKNEKLINLQMQILKKDWQSQHDRVAGEMQQMLEKIDQLSEQISHEANPNERDLKLKKMDVTTQQLDEYIQNISEMGQKLTLITDFVNHIRKNLLRVEGKINEMKDQLNTVGNDIKFLRGKSVEQLLEIRKWKVLKEAAQRNVKSIYVPLKTQEKGKVELSYLMNLEQLDDRVGEVNEFLLEEEKTVMLIHGIAGSGKSTTAKKIEEFMWKLQENKKKIRNIIFIPVYISLPSLKNPVFQAVEDTLLQDDYGFDNLQLKECKQKLENKEFRFLLIMDSYDEMKLENIQKNLYLTNKLKQNWSDPLVIFTTRSEIFTSNNYMDWFMPEEKNKFKEVLLLKFDKEQEKEYLKKFTMQNIKMLIFDTYELQMQIKKLSIDVNKFELCWEKLLSKNFQTEGQNMKSDVLLNQKQIQTLLEYLKDDEFIDFKNNEALRSLTINFEKLWSIQKYENIMKQINSNKLVETPYMMEIIVQVLPYMMTKAQDITNMKQNFIKNFSKMFKDLLKSSYIIKMYRQQQKKLMIDINNQIQDEQFIVTHSDVQNLKQIDYYQVSLKVWDKLEENSIPKQLQISQDFIQLHKLVVNKLEPILLLLQNTYDKVAIKNESIISLVFDSLKEYNLTSFDFYSEFINYHYLRQIEKQKNLGKSMNIYRFLLDLQIYSIKLAKLMSKNEITQVQYIYQGLLYKEEREEEKWLDEFFNDDVKNGSYKKDIRSCSLVQKKGANFSFAHKSIQEFLIAADLYGLLIQARDLDVQTLKCVINRFQREQNQDQDSMKFLNELDLSLLDINVNNLPLFERQQKQIENEKKINLIINLIKQIKKHDFNVINYSSEIYTETRKYLIQKISQDSKIIELLKFLVQITKIDQSLIQSGSNSINLLVEMKVNLSMINFQNINIRNTSILGGNFVKCNLSGSKFENVNINGINLNGAQMFNCRWKNLRINELFQLDGHIDRVSSVCISPDGTILASGSGDKSIRLWDIKTGQLKSQLDGHSSDVLSVRFSPAGTILASGSRDKQIRLWDVKTGQLKSQLDGHSNVVLSVCFSPDGTILASSGDNSIRLWDIKTGQLKSKLDGQCSEVYSVCFSPDGTILASSGDNSIRLWDVKTGQLKSRLVGHIDNVLSVCFSPDGTILASGSLDKPIHLLDGTILASGSIDKSIRLWDVKTGQTKYQLDGDSNGVYSVCFSPDGTILASGSYDNSIRLWDVKTGQLKSKLVGHSDNVLSVCFSPDGTILSSGSGDKYIRLWDLKTGQLKSQLDGHSSLVFSVCFSPDGTILASCSYDQSIRLWDFKTGQLKSQLDGLSSVVQSVCFSIDGTILASGSRDKAIRLWDVKTGQLKSQLDGHRSDVLSVCFTPDGTILASGSRDKSIRLWDVKTGQLKSKLDGHSSVVQSVCFSIDGTILASGSRDKAIRLWDVKTGQLKSQLDGHSSVLYSVCFSPDGTLLASGSSLWDVKTGQLKSQLDGRSSVVYSVCFSPDGTLLASGGDNSIRLWDVKTGQLRSQLDGHTSDVYSVCFSPNGTILASGSGDNSIRLWDVKTAQLKSSLDGHTSDVYSVCFSPDGTILASGSGDNSICLWDFKTGQQIEPQEKKYIDILKYFKAPLHQNSLLAKGTSNITILIINQQPLFQAQSTLILKGQFYNQLGIDLTKLFIQKGCCILEQQN